MAGVVDKSTAQDGVVGIQSQCPVDGPGDEKFLWDLQQRKTLLSFTRYDIFYTITDMSIIASKG